MTDEDLLNTLINKSINAMTTLALTLYEEDPDNDLTDRLEVLAAELEDYQIKNL